MVRGADTTGVASAEVVLHRATTEQAGEIDTVQAGPDGRFVFDLPAVPDPVGRGDVYLGSVNHQGVLYFGPPVHEAVQLDSLYRIVVHDTAMAPEEGAALPILVRYIVLDPAEGGWSVTDMIQVEHAGERTLVRPEGEVVWRYPMPPGASDLQVGPGDAVNAIALVDGMLEVTAPVSPGVQEYLVGYSLPEQRLEVPLPGPVGQIELLVQEPGPPLAVQGLMLNEPAEMEPGVTYRRYTAVGIEDQRVVVLPGTTREPFRREWLVVIMALVLAAGALWAGLRSPAREPAVSGAAPMAAPMAGTVADRRERLLLEAAQLEERLEQEALPEDERERILGRRREILESLRGLA